MEKEFCGLAVVLGLGAMCVFDVPVAHAGEWEIIPMPARVWPGQAGYENWLAEANKRYSGTYNASSKNPPFTNYPPYYQQPPALLSAPVEETRSLSEVTSGFGDIGSVGGAATLELDGDVSVLLRYQPDMINGEADPQDIPQKPFYLKIGANLGVFAWSTGKDSGGDFHSSGSEKASALVTPAGDLSIIRDDTVQEVRDSDTVASSDKEFLIKVNPGGRMEITQPIFSIDAKSSLTDNRISVVDEDFGPQKYYDPGVLGG